jgi:hypothetical protein
MPGPGDRPHPLAVTAASPKKAYRPPVLAIYGDIRRLTLNVGNKGATSDGGGMFAKTQ